MERGLKIMVDQAAGRVPVYFGIGAISTKKCCRLAKMAWQMGPQVFRTSAHVLKAYGGRTSTFTLRPSRSRFPRRPWLLYNNPGRVNYTMSGKLVERLAHEVPNIVGMKDTSGDITQTAEFIRRTRDVGFKVFGGKDTLLYASMCHGAVGGVCTAANFMPELITDVYNKFVAGDLQGLPGGAVQIESGCVCPWTAPASRWRQRTWQISGAGTSAIPISPICPPPRARCLTGSRRR